MISSSLLYFKFKIILNLQHKSLESLNKVITYDFSSRIVYNAERKMFYDFKILL